MKHRLIITINTAPHGAQNKEDTMSMTYIGEYDADGATTICDAVAAFADHHHMDCYVTHTISRVANNVSIVVSDSCKRCAMFQDGKDIVLAALVAHAQQFQHAQVDPVAIMRRHGMTQAGKGAWYATSEAQFHRLCDDQDRFNADITCHGQTAEKGRWYACIERD